LACHASALPTELIPRMVERPSGPAIEAMVGRPRALSSLRSRRRIGPTPDYLSGSAPAPQRAGAHFPRHARDGGPASRCGRGRGPTMVAPTRGAGDAEGDVAPGRAPARRGTGMRRLGNGWARGVGAAVALIGGMAGRLDAQGVEQVKANYTKYEYRIPMRDGA